MDPLTAFAGVLLLEFRQLDPNDDWISASLVVHMDDEQLYAAPRISARPKQH